MGGKESTSTTSLDLSIGVLHLEDVLAPDLN
jgi:hypothetical protein